MPFASPSPTADNPAPSSAAATVLIASPADHAQGLPAVTEITVTFPEEVDYLWTDGDLLLQRVEPDGSVTTYLGAGDMPPATFDPSGSILTIRLDAPLPDGHYRLVLAGGSLESLILGAGIWDGTEDQVLSDFQVGSKGATLADATDLGTVGADVTTASNTLDLSARSDVQYYKVTLPAGHEWRLGIEVDAQSIGSPLRPALSLFDASGKLIGTPRDSGTGRPGSTNDPYLFQKLDAGVYYIGISGASNLPAEFQAGGYDPVSGTFGVMGSPHAGGAYRLQLSADAIDSPTYVTGFSLHWADSLDPSPTTLTVGFSGPLDGQSLLSANSLVAVDANGREWPLIPVRYQEALSQVTFAFGLPLPAGSYRLVAPQGGLTDLVGDVPVAKGLAPGVLATWDVDARQADPDATDLGVVWPSRPAGASSSFAVPAGETTTLRVVVTVEGFYTMTSATSGGTLKISRVGQGGTIVDQVVGGRDFAFLSPGIYLFNFVATGDQAVMVDWQIKGTPQDPESLISNGIGQSAALTLRVAGTPVGGLRADGPATLATVNPWSPFHFAMRAVDGADGPTAPEPNTAGPGSPVLPSPRAGEPSVGAVYAGALPVSLDSSPAGRPVSQVVAGSEQGLPPGRALVAQGLQAGILGSRSVYPWDAKPDPNTDAVSGDDEDPVVDRSTEDVPKARTADEAIALASAAEDDRAIRRADEVAELTSSVLRWIFPGSSSPGEEADGPVDRSGSASGGELARETGERGPGREPVRSRPHSDRNSRAELIIPLGVLAVAAGAYHLQRLAARWWRRPSPRLTPAAYRLHGRPHLKRRRTPRNPTSC